MTYIPPERDEPALDQTQKLDATALPAVGNGVDVAGPPSPFQPASASDQPIDPFIAAVGEIDTGGGEAGPPRDRLTFQFLWEAILLVLAAGAVFLVYLERESIFGTEFPTLWDAASAHTLALVPILLGVLALGLSLRIGAVNLAVPAAVYMVTSARPLSVDPWMNLAWTAGAAAAAALVFALLVLVIRTPPWFAGIVTALAIWATLPLLPRLGPELEGNPEVWESSLFQIGVVAGAVVLAIGGGLLGLLPAVRDRFSSVKSMIDGTGGRSAPAVWTFLACVLGSMLLAFGAGFLMSMLNVMVREEESSLNFGVYAFTGQSAIGLEAFVFIAVLLAGTSLWGRRGGVLGAVLATVLLWAGLLLWENLVAPSDDQELYASIGSAVFVGALVLAVLISLGLDRLGRPKDRSSETGPAPVEPQPFGPNGTGLFEPARPEQNTTA
ncbi:hypothetical protein [Glycomyces buryatensis]|uniref:ABC transporter permease n=1 Tax=Glycomyces buryatensis TaxID=2570927 RepID=A0A4S8PRP0_9ACTN|nr:hypothetical protein [Glycomyces buryatensis]THV33940.1 hypothetical protein FAB82_24505 [Glycomyces buryatensis]